MNAIFFRRRRKFYCKPGSDHQSDACLAALLKNLEPLGFTLSPALQEVVRTLAAPRLESFYKELSTILREAVGGRPFAPMYPDFPQQVMEASEAELYLNALRHYATGKLPSRSKRPRPALEGLAELRVVDLGTKQEFEEILTTLLQSKAPWSAVDQGDVAWFVAQHRDDVARLVPPTIPSKENLAFFAAQLLKKTAVADEVVGSRVKTATDVLRIAVALSGGDVSLATPTRFVSAPRKERKRLLGWLERTGGPAEDMRRWPERWKRLGERLHPRAYADRFPLTAAAFAALRSGASFPTFNVRIEACLARKDVAQAIETLSARPGDLTRRLDHLMRLASNPQPVLDAFREAAPCASTPVLLQTLAHFRRRDEPRPLRAFFPKGNVAKVFAVPNRLPTLPAGAAAEAAAICEGALVARFRELPPLGKCWIEPALADFLAPFSQRSASKSLRTLVRGSRLPLPPGPVVRFFLWWKNGRSGHTDVDLSAAMFDADYRFVDVVSYYNLKSFGGCHSGDVVDAPHGAAEFIDVDLDRLRAQGVRYVVASINSYSGEPFCDLPECFAGWMGRRSAGSGEIFEPSTVQDKVDVAADSKICLPLVLDVEARQAIWADVALRSAPRWNNVHNNLSGVSLMLRSLDSLVKMDLYTLFELHVRARGAFAERNEAERVFSVREGTTPFDLDRIAADFM